MAAVCVVQCMVRPLLADNAFVNRLLARGTRSAAFDELNRMDAGQRRNLVTPLLAELDLETDPNIIRDVTFALGELKEDGQAAVPALIQRAHDSDRAKRNGSLMALSKISPQSEEIITLFKESMKSDDWTTRLSGAVGLAAAAPAYGSVKALAQGLKDPDPQVRVPVAGMFGNLKDKSTDAVPELVAALGDNDANVQNLASVALGQQGAGAVPDLIRILKEGPLSSRRWAAVALTRIGSPARDAVPALVDSLDKGDDALTDQALVALAKAGPIGPEYIPKIIQVVSAKKRQIQFLGPIGPGLLPTLTSFLKDPDPSVRSQAAFAIAQMGSSAGSAVPSLINDLSSTDNSVRLQAINALGEIGSPGASEAISPLKGLLTDTDPVVRVAASGALAKLDPQSPEGMPKLIVALESGDYPARYEAVTALMHMGPAAKPAEDALLHTLQAPEEVVRKSAMIALSNIGPESTSLMLQALQDKNEDVRFMAASLLGAAHDNSHEVIQALAKALTDPSPVVRNMATSTLEKIDTPEAREALKHPWRKKNSPIWIIVLWTFIIGSVLIFVLNRQSNARNNK